MKDCYSMYEQMLEASENERRKVNTIASNSRKHLDICTTQHSFRASETPHINEQLDACDIKTSTGGGQHEVLLNE